MYAERQFAGFPSRMKAFSFDLLLIIGYTIVLVATTLAFVSVASLLGRDLSWPANPLWADLLAFMTLMLPVILYFTLEESSSRGAAWGKRKARMRVVNAEGSRLTKGRAFIRAVFKFLPWQIAHTSIFHIEGWPLAPSDPTLLVKTGFILVWVMVIVYVGSLAFTKDRRTPYDWVAGSYVVGAT